MYCIVHVWKLGDVIASKRLYLPQSAMTTLKSCCNLTTYELMNGFDVGRLLGWL